MNLNKYRKKFRFLKKIIIKFEKIIFNVFNSILPNRIKYYFLKNKIYIKKKGEKIFSLRNYSSTCVMRAETFFTKEPDTIKWIESFNKNEVFLDIGANIGIYSLYAAKNVSKVWAIEPESLNFAMLNLNIFDNDLSSKITALPLSLHENTKIDLLSINNLDWGEALNSFNNTKDQFGKNFIPSFYQGSYSIKLDDLINFIGRVDHVKVDVDGNEDVILAGALKTLKEKKIKSLLIELDENLKNYETILENIIKDGYILKSKTASPFHLEIFGSTKNHIFYSE
jgi:FkbM family methyltransferase